MLKWNDIKYRTLLDIREAANIEDENERAYAIMEAVFGEDVLDLDLKSFALKCKEIEFLQKPIPNDLHIKDIKVNGREYYFDGLLGNITTAQYIDFQNYQKNNDEYKTFSVFIIPKGHKYNDGYDMLQVIDDIKSIPIPIVNSLSFFFSRQFKESMRIFQSYLTKEMKTMNIPKEAKENLIKVVENSVRLVLSPLS